MKQADGTQAQVTLSGRELALMRRQAMALHGKAGVVRAMAIRPAAQIASGTATGTSRPALSMAAGPVGTPRDAAAPALPSVAPAMAASFSGPITTPAGLDAGSTRDLARARRAALATDGQAGLRRVAQTVKLATVLPVQDWHAAIDKGATGRQVAMQRRLVRSLVGRDDSPSDTPSHSGHMRARNEPPALPPKVEQGHTLSGRPVTGTMLDSSRRVTGTEAGLCRNVTGTEYLGREQFETSCDTRPAPGPAKVGTSSTLREQKVTGTEIGRSARVTGDEVGACRGITGTEYLAREHFESVCQTTPAAPPRKVSVMPTQGGQHVSGSDVERAAKVTGDESGASRQLTGSQYMQAPVARPPMGARPPKVAVVETLAGSTVTGTELAASPRVTGDDRGRCRPVTGTEYIGPGQLQAVCETTTQVAPVAKVGQDQTWRGQAITGSQIGRSSRVTGDESGGCAAISGTPYIGRGQYKAFCEAPQLAAQEAQLRTEALIPAAAVTGDRPGAGGSVMTGDARGACGLVSGTPYVGRDNAPAHCPVGSGRFVSRPQPPLKAPAAPAPQDFSIWPPSRQAQERERATQAVTGSAFSNQRITGPLNKAGGLITGTPEFRHSEAAPAQAPQADGAVGVRAAERLTGEGSQAGTRISGDTWQASSRVTGTAGASSLARNPSQRGPVRGMGMGMNAQQFRDVERAAQPESRITGSSGNTAKGASVTLSGGARG